MQAFKELYWRYSLFVLILGLGVTIFIELTPFLGGVLGAMTIYVLLRRQMHYLTACRKWRRSLAASLLLGEAVLCFLVPISLIVWMVVNQVQDIALAPESVVEPLKHIAALIHDKTGYNLWQEKNITSLVGVIPRLGQWVLGSIMDFGINIIVLLFVLYFMLIGGLRMEGYCREILPFNRDVGSSVMREVHMIVRSNAIGIPLLAVVQGVVAFVGYLVFNAPSPLFWGVLTCFATIIPIFGTALIWLPLAGYMALTGDWGPAIGVGQLGIRLFCDPLVPPFGWAEVLRVATNHIVCLLAAEGEFHIGRCVLGSIGAAEHGSFPVGSAGLAIEGKGNAVKQGGLPRSGLAGDEVKASVPQPGKVHRHRFSIRAEGG